jgi:hypothetical protein
VHLEEFEDTKGKSESEKSKKDKHHTSQKKTNTKRQTVITLEF